MHSPLVLFSKIVTEGVSGARPEGSDVHMAMVSTMYTMLWLCEVELLKYRENIMLR